MAEERERGGREGDQVAVQIFTPVEMSMAIAEVARGKTVPG